MVSENGSSIVRFGVFEVDLRAGELRRNGSKVKLQEQPFQVLTLLLERPGDVVTREELRQKLWGTETFVDFDHSLNAAIRRLRDALGDSAEHPRYVETVARRGYRFLAPLNGHSNGSVHASTLTASANRRWLWISAGVLIILGVGLAIGWFAGSRSASSRPNSERRLTANPADVPVLGGCISRDGRYLAYSDRTGMYLKVVDTGETHPVQLPEGFHPEPVSWFPDGTHIASSWVENPSQEPSIWDVSVFGGSPRKLTDQGADPSVSPDGKQITFYRGGKARGEIWIMQSDGQGARRLVGGVASVFSPVAWSPIGTRIAYVSATYYPGASSTATQLHTINLSTGESRIMLTDPRLGPGIAWNADGRLIYSKAEPRPNQDDYNLWALRLDANGNPVGSPERLTRDPGFTSAVTLSTDGRRAAFFKHSLQPDVYVVDIQDGGKRLATPQRLTLDEREDYPYSWTADSQAVLFTSDRDGTFQIYKQRIDQTTPELMVGGAEQLSIPRISPDGQTILYLITPKLGETSNQVRLMRVPVSGGPPQLVVEGPGISNHQCARARSTLCIFSQITENEMQFYTFDPMRGRGPEFDKARISGEDSYSFNWSLSPDGHWIASATKIGINQNTAIRLFSVADGTVQEITVASGAGLSNLDWAADGKSLWVTSFTTDDSWTLLNVDLQGKVRPIFKDERMRIGWAIPSPDGKRLAMWESSGSSNVWMLEDF